jgi:UDP-glucose 4-epimerase
MKKIAIVTGGAGFIGSHMADKLLEENYKVRIIDNFSGGHQKNLLKHINNNDLQIEEKNINTIENTNSIFKNVDVVFHFAGIGDIVPSIEQPVDYIKTNVMGTVNILESSRNNNIKKFIYAASSSCYGLAKTPTDESHIIDPKYPYALSKYQGEQCALHWASVYGLNVKSIRIFNAYGRRVRTTGAYGAVFGVFLKQYLSGKPLTIVGDGSQKRDFIHVKDVANAFFQLYVSSTSQKIFNLGAGNPISVKELAEIIGGKFEYIEKRPGEPDITWANTTRIQSELNWSPLISFKEGVNEMIDNIKEWEDAPLWDKTKIAIATKNWFKYLDK